MAQLVQTEYLNRLALALLISPSETPPSPPLAAAKMMLYTNEVPITPDTVFDDLVEATFSGYARSAVVVWGTPLNETNGTVTTLSPGKTFSLASADPLVTERIVGCAIIDSGTPPKLLAACAFDQEVNLTHVGDGFMLVVAINEGSVSANSEATLIS